jgi:hypothetical protein
MDRTHFTIRPLSAAGSFARMLPGIFLSMHLTDAPHQPRRNGSLINKVYLLHLIVGRRRWSLRLLTLLRYPGRADGLVPVRAEWQLLARPVLICAASSQLPLYSLNPMVAIIHGRRW